MDIGQMIWLYFALTALCWFAIPKILQRGWQRHIKNMWARRVVVITASTVFALPTVIMWAMVVVAERFWDVALHPFVREYAELANIRKEDDV